MSKSAKARLPSALFGMPVPADKSAASSSSGQDGSKAGDGGKYGRAAALAGTCGANCRARASRRQPAASRLMPDRSAGQLASIVPQSSAK
jgi:hypothetical protein